MQRPTGYIRDHPYITSVNLGTFSDPPYLSISSKVENILKGSLDLIPSPLPSVKIQIMGGKVYMSCKGKTLLGIVNKRLETKSLLTTSSNVLSFYIK